MTPDTPTPTIGHTLVSIVKWFYLAYAVLALYFIWAEYRRYKRGDVTKKRFKRTVILEGIMFVLSLTVFVMNIVGGY